MVFISGTRPDGKRDGIDRATWYAQSGYVPENLQYLTGLKGGLRAL